MEIDRQVTEYRRIIKQKNNSNEALFRLGIMHHKGVGVQKDDFEANKCFREAALNNHPGAQAKYGHFIAMGMRIQKI